LKQVLEEEKLPYFEASGEAAFYGPKIDVQMKSVTGREETASTIQLDISSAKRLGLKYVGPDNQEQSPFIIHRAPLGTHERTVAFLIEHFGGNFPLWLSPVQVRVIPVSDRYNDYAHEVVLKLRESWIRAEGDDSPHTLRKKIRNASLCKVPLVAVVGAREEASGTVSLRRRGVKEQSVLKVAQWIADIERAMRVRSIQA
jgi:threonyl-tRNA synthetase